MEIENSRNNITNLYSSASGIFKESAWKLQRSLNDFKSTGNSYSFVNSIPNSTLKYSNQYLRLDDWEHIANTFSTNKNYNTIELLGISINDAGLKKLGEIIVENPNIISVKLQWNYLNEYSEEFEYFCNCLANSNVKTINLSNNRINSHLCKSIVKIIASSNRVVSIDLSWNELCDEGARILIDSLNLNSSLQDLNLSGNKISEEYLEEISEYINRNRCSNLSKFNSNETNFSNHPHKINTNTTWIDKSPLRDSAKVENVSLRFLEKEKEISEEYKARYDVQLIINAKLEKRIKELESLIELEKKNVENARVDSEKEKSNEINLRIKYEEQVVNLKQELLKITVEKDKLANDGFIKITHLENKLSNLENENKSLKETLNRFEEKSEDKTKLIKEEYENNYLILNSTVDNLRKENEKIRKEVFEENKKHLEEFENKIRSLEHANLTLKMQKDEIIKANMDLKKRSIDLQIETEEKLIEREVEIIRQEKLKTDSIINSLEKRIKNLESSKQELIERNKTFIQEISNIKKSSIDEIKEKEIEINSLKIDNNNLNKSYSNLSSELNKLNLDLKSKDCIISKLKLQINDNKKELDTIKLNLEDKLNNFQEKNLELKQVWENKKIGYETKIAELEIKIENLKTKLSRLENDDVKFSEIIKKEISKHINENF